MEKRINRQLLMMGFAASLLTLLLTATTFYSLYENNLRDSLHNDLQLVVSSYETMNGTEMLEVLQTSSLRITLIDTDGTVIYDSAIETASMDDHSLRPEIQQAFVEGYGDAVRYSDTFGDNLYYAAQRLSDGRVIRCAVSGNVLRDFLYRSAVYLLLIFLVVVVLSIWLSAMLTERLIYPIKAMTNDPDDPSFLIDEDESVYPELAPLIKELRLRRREIRDKIRQIEQEHTRLTAVLENMEEGLLLLDIHGKILSVNSSACRYFHFKEKHMGRVFAEVCSEERLCMAVAEAYDGKRASMDLTRDGRLLHMMIEPVMNAKKILGVVCLTVDVTERRELERMKQEFTANVSHELKTPLTSVLGYAEMIENGMAKPQDVPHFAAQIRREASRLLSLIADILMLSKIEEQDGYTCMQTVDLHEIAFDCVERLASRAADKQVTLRLDGLRSTIYADPTMLDQLCYNLIDNAIRYNREDGTVWVTIGERMLTVKDNGIGIPEEHKNRIFERFYRVDKSRSKETGGTGLGLAIVKHIAEVHQATVTLSSEEHVGTTVRVVFPK